MGKVTKQIKKASPLRKSKVKEREVVIDLYVNKLWNQKEISEFLAISENTITKWKKQDEGTGNDWDKQREKTIGDPNKLKAAILAEMVSITNGEAPKLNADGLYKLFRIIEGLNDRINPGTVAAIMKQYDEFLLVENKELAVTNLPYNKKFLTHIINIYG